MNPYRVWRRQLTELQDKIMAYDEDLDNYDEDFVNYWANRKPLIDELEAHYALEEDAVAAQEAWFDAVELM